MHAPTLETLFKRLCSARQRFLRIVAESTGSEDSVSMQLREFWVYVAQEVSYY
jgi:hypothetical protein